MSGRSRARIPEVCSVDVSPSMEQPRPTSIRQALVAPLSIIMAESSILNHPTGGRRGNVKGPTMHLPLPDLPPLLHRDESSDSLEEEREAERPRSTSTTPRSGSGKHLEPLNTIVLSEVHQLDPPLKEKSKDQERTDVEEHPTKRVSLLTPLQFLTFAVLVLGKARGE